MSNEHIRSVGQSVGNMLDLPKEIILNLPRIIVIGNVQVNIENHQGIVLYQPEDIRVNCSLGHIVVEGSELMVTTITPDELYIEGKISDIHYEREKK